MSGEGNVSLNEKKLPEEVDDENEDEDDERNETKHLPSNLTEDLVEPIEAKPRPGRLWVMFVPDCDLEVDLILEPTLR